MKYILLFVFIGASSFLFGQAPDGNPDTFTAVISGNWVVPSVWSQEFGTDLDGIPDGDDQVIINNVNVTVTLDAGFGSLTINSAGFSNRTFTINSGRSLTGYSTVESGEIFVNAGTNTAKTLTVNIASGSVSCTGLTLTNPDTDAKVLFQIQDGGTLTIENDLVLNSTSTDTKIALNATTGTGNTLNLGGTITGLSTSKGVIDMGSSAGVSTFNFNGSAAQIIPFDDPSDLIYSDIQISNAAGVTFQSASASANFTGDLTVSAGGVFNDGGFANVFDGDITNAGTYNGSGTIDLTGDFTNSGTFTSSGCNINIEGDWDNTGGTYTYFSGDNFTFDGALASTITGATDWYELTADNPGGVAVSSGAQSIHGILDLDQGTFTSGGLVTLISDPTSTGQMDDIGTGTFSGDLTVQRQIVKSLQSFISIGSPVSGTTLASWQDDNIIYSGDGPGTFTGADVENFHFHNTYWYDEGAADGTMNNGFTKAATTAQAVGVSNAFRAFHIYTDAVTYNLDVTGVPNTGTVNIPLQYDGAFAGNQAGWNLIANPYPCTIDFDAFFGGAMVNGYFVYNDGLANYNYWDGGTGFPLNPGMTSLIPHTQGFWVRSTGLTSLPISESDKSTTDQAFYKSSNGSYMRIALSGNVNTFGDGAIILERDDYTENYDVDVDIQKFLTLNPNNAPSLYTITPDGYNLCFNKIADESISIPLVAKAGTLAQGGYTLDFDIPSTFMLGACITLEDLHTGVIIDLRSDTAYSYVSTDTTTLPRFILHMVKDFNTAVVDLTCFGTTEGLVTIDGVGITGSTFELLDGAGSAIFSGTAANDTVEFSSVPAGEYQVATNHIGSCSSGNFFISVIEPAQVIANFDLVEDTIYLAQGGLLEVNNMSSATNYAWDFGDGNASIDENPTHVYTAPGVYQVMLTSDNDNVGQCTDVTSKNAVVMNGPLSIDDTQLEENTNAFVSNGKVVVDFALENHTTVEIILVDVNGKIILSKEYAISKGRIDLVNTDEVSNGVYFVNITIAGQRKSQKLFVD